MPTPRLPRRCLTAWLGLAAAACQGPAPVPSAAPPATLAPHEYSRPYRFTEDWFSEHITTWRRLLAPLAGRPGLRYLEIGTWEGRSAFWVLDNILTHPTAHMTTIDVFPGDVQERYRENLRLSGRAEQVTTLVGRSQEEVRKLPYESFDLVYVDGSHAADDVLADAVQAWAVVKPGGIVIFDDYTWPGYKNIFPLELRPQIALDTFLAAYAYSLEVLDRRSQLVLRKQVNPCVQPGHPDVWKDFCTPVGDYLYDWPARTLRRRADGRVVELGPGEREMLEAYERRKRFELKETTPPVTRQELEQLGRRLGRPTLFLEPSPAPTP